MLTRIERQELRRVRAMVQTGDRAGALSALRAMEERPPSRDMGESQLLLMLALETGFRCDRLNVDEMRIRDCLVRRSRVWPSGGGRGSAAPAATACVGCPVGAGWAARLPSFVPPKSTLAAEVLSPSQRAAKRAAWSEPTEESLRTDPMRDAAQLTPDDVNDWRA